jgi:hypothetical protein
MTRRQPDTAIHWAVFDGRRLAGTIDKINDLFTARGADDELVGTFSTLRAAAAALPGAPMNINERKLRHLFAAEGLRVLEIRCRKHWVAKVARDNGRPFSVAVSCSPSDFRFHGNFIQSLRRAERASLPRRD